MAIALIPPVVTYTSGDSTFSRDSETGIYKLLGTKKSVTPASTLNAQSSLKNIQRNQLADGNPIPLIYGHAQVGGMPFAIDYDSGTWTVGYIVCYGEIEGFESVLINGAAPVSGVEGSCWRSGWCFQRKWQSSPRVLPAGQACTDLRGLK